MVNASNILVIKLGALGDFVICLGMMREIRRAYPHARLTLLTGKAFMGIAESSGWFDEILMDNRERWNFSAWYRIIKKGFLDHAFDLVIDLQKSSRTQGRYFQLMRWFSRRGQTWLSVFRNKKWELRSICPRGYFLPARVTESETDPFFSYAETDLTFCKGPHRYFSLLPENYVLLIPGCSPAHPYKRWPAKSYATLAKRICDTGNRVVVMGTTAEAKAVNAIVSVEPRAVNFLGKSTLLDIPALAMRARVVVGNDTGPVHMASFCRIPVVALFSQKTAASRRNAENVTNFCGQTIDDISVEEVWQAVRPFLEKQQDE